MRNGSISTHVACTDLAATSATTTRPSCRSLRRVRLHQQGRIEQSRVLVTRVLLCLRAPLVGRKLVTHETVDEGAQFAQLVRLRGIHLALRMRGEGAEREKKEIFRKISCSNVGDVAHDGGGFENRAVL